MQGLGATTIEIQIPCLSRGQKGRFLKISQIVDGFQLGDWVITFEKYCYIISFDVSF